jgi:hypothetical protein
LVIDNLLLDADNLKILLLNMLVQILSLPYMAHNTAHLGITSVNWDLAWT